MTNANMYNAMKSRVSNTSRADNYPNNFVSDIKQ
jgi:hypothetical protein